MKKKDKKPFIFYPEFGIAVINPQTAQKLIKNHEKAIRNQARKKVD